MRSFSLLLAFIFISCSSASNGGDPPAPVPQPEDYTLEAAFPNLTFGQPLDLQHAGDGSGRIFVVERAGVINVFSNDAAATETTVFLDISDRVDTRGEGGLLGLTFHPDYESNGFFYVNYTTPNPFRTIVSRFQVSGDDADRADEASETEIITYDQPFSNHNGGQVRFGPDGYLYIAAGDGGSGGDPQGNAQNRSTLLGNILRIDVDQTQNGLNYGIPSDNPYAGNDQGFREEIYAYGLRNPYRFSFDAETDLLWAADVGQNAYEEIDVIESGNNYGWNILEGDTCYEPAQDCDRTGLTDPIFVYDHSNGDRSVTGGFVYRGPQEGLTGWYIYGDFVSGRLWALDASATDDPENVLIQETGLNISGFGVDENNELYLTAFDGVIYKLVPE